MDSASLKAAVMAHQTLAVETPARRA